MIQKKRKNVLIAGFIGNVVEWYDFALYGFFASVFSRIFFPESSGTANLLAVYGIFAAGFVMRPIGSVVFGWMGDRWGRSRTMMVSVALMALPTMFLGLLPDYQSIGLAAPVTLVALRLIQGLSVGGEFSTSVVYLVETADEDKRGRAGSMANLGSITGIALGSLMAMAVLNLLPQDQAYDWGWRVAYFIGGIIGVAALWLRRHLPRSPAFELQKQDQKPDTPIKETLTTVFPQTLKATIFAGGYGVLFYLATVYFPNWLANHQDIDLKVAMRLNTATLIVMLPAVYLSGWLSDRFIDRKWLVSIALLMSAFIGWGSFEISLDGSFMTVILSQFSLALRLAVLLGTAPVLFTTLFPARNRNTGYSISYAIGMGIIGGATPMTATWLIDITGHEASPGYLLAGVTFIATLAVLSMRNTSQLDLNPKQHK